MMERRHVVGAIGTIVLAIAGLAGCGNAGGKAGGGGAAGGATPLTLAVIPKGSTHEHWARVRLGAEKAAAELTAAGTPVRILWKGPIREDDREQQIQVVEGFTSQGVQGIILAPLDSRALKRPLACELAPTVHDVRVHAMQHRHLGYRCPRRCALLQHQRLQLCTVPPAQNDSLRCHRVHLSA